MSGVSGQSSSSITSVGPTEDVLRPTEAVLKPAEDVKSKYI
jgi:hypothetical protein